MNLHENPRQIETKHNPNLKPFSQDTNVEYRHWALRYRWRTGQMLHREDTEEQILRPSHLQWLWGWTAPGQNKLGPSLCRTETCKYLLTYLKSEQDYPLGRVANACRKRKMQTIWKLIIIKHSLQNRWHQRHGKKDNINNEWRPFELKKNKALYVQVLISIWICSKLQHGDNCSRYLGHSHH